MSRNLLFIFILLPCLSWSQTPDKNSLVKVSETFWAKQNATYLDRMEVEIEKTYLDIDNIKEIEFHKDKVLNNYTWYNGPLLIIRKNKIPLVALNELLFGLSENYKHPFHFIINNKLISDTLGVKIELSAIKNIDIIKCENSFNDPHLCHGTGVILKANSFNYSVKFEDANFH